jgi:NAD(P)-dependent dehydrogenase (short-subunit alcohol dehydrogenase family)
MGALSGHVSVVTGGNGGIGLGIALALAGAGADVAVWGRNEAKNAEALDALSATGVRAVALRCDVSDEDQVTAAFDQTLHELGKVDSLFANAGVGGFAPFTQMSLAEFRRVTSINLDGAFLTLRAAAAHMVERGEGGSLVGISSVSAIHGAPGMEHYAASKAGVIGFTQSLAKEVARMNITVNAVCPGYVETDAIANLPTEHRKSLLDRIPMRRLGRPEDVASAIDFLASDDAGYITGATLKVDGGIL